jgi:hypothetical protein
MASSRSRLDGHSWDVAIIELVENDDAARLSPRKWPTEIESLSGLNQRASTNQSSTGTIEMLV